MLSIRLNAFVSPISQSTVSSESIVSEPVQSSLTPAASTADAITTCIVNFVPGRNVRRSSRRPTMKAPILPRAMASTGVGQCGTKTNAAVVPANTATPPNRAVG